MQSGKAGGERLPAGTASQASNTSSPSPDTGSGMRLTFEGESVAARPGESLASALTAAGKLHLRKTPKGTDRGVFCGMGVCRDCLVDIGERRNVRACMTKVEPGMEVRRAGTGGPPRAPKRDAGFRLIDEVTTDEPDVFVIGAGPAGLSAALAARQAGARVVLADERARPGGQFFKQASDGAPLDAQQEEGRALIDRVVGAGVELWPETLVWGGFGPLEFAVNRGGGTEIVKPRAAVYAAGAYERPWPVPGWTLPGVMTTGAAQTMWRSDKRLAGKRVLVAGNGPLNLQLAAELSAGGAKVVAVVETARKPRTIAKAAAMAFSAPGLVAQGLRYLATCMRAGIPLIYRSHVTKISENAEGLTAHISGAAERSFDADIVCLGYGFIASGELPRAMGARSARDPLSGQFVVSTGPDHETSVPGLFAVGDCTGLNGARVALAQGTLAGAAAAKKAGHAQASNADLIRASAALRRHQRFQRALWSLYAPTVTAAPATPETIVCRCEELALADVMAAYDQGYRTAGPIKQRTRMGMGPCQGRYCGVILNQLLHERGENVDEYGGFAPRHPAKPFTIGSLAADPAE